METGDEVVTPLDSTTLNGFSFFYCLFTFCRHKRCSHVELICTRIFLSPRDCCAFNWISTSINVFCFRSAVDAGEGTPTYPFLCVWNALVMDECWHFVLSKNPISVCQLFQPSKVHWEVRLINQCLGVSAIKSWNAAWKITGMHQNALMNVSNLCYTVGKETSTSWRNVETDDADALNALWTFPRRITVKTVTSVVTVTNSPKHPKLLIMLLKSAVSVHSTAASPVEFFRAARWMAA